MLLKQKNARARRNNWVRLDNTYIWARCNVIGWIYHNLNDFHFSDNVAMGKDLELGVARNPDVQLEYQHEKCSTYPTCKRQNKLPESDSNPFDKGHLENNGASAKSTDPLVESRDFENPIGLSDVSQIKDKGSCETREQPTLDFSLKRLRGAGDVGACVHDDRNSLRHSDLSAFSK